jgi:YD repeat-containing protein
MMVAISLFFIFTVITGAEENNVLFSDNFNYQELSGWVKQVSHGTQFGQSGNTIRIIHSTASDGFDSIKRDFAPLTEAVFEFDVRLGSRNNDNFSLLFESDGGYTSAGGLGLAFQGNTVMAYTGNGWRTIGNVSFDEWRHCRVVSTPGWIAIYINDDLKYQRSGSFRVRSFMKFSDFGRCSGIVTNYLTNIRVRTASTSDRFIRFSDYNHGTLNGWNINNPGGSQFTPEQGAVKISQVPGSWGQDYLQQSFEPLQNVVLEFDAFIRSINNYSYSLLLESDDTPAGGFFLGFFRNEVNGYSISTDHLVCHSSALIENDKWNHYRLVYSASRIEIYINGELQSVVPGIYGPRSYFRFSNPGIYAVTNWIDNVSVRPYPPEQFSDNEPVWTSDWTVNNPEGTQFIHDIQNNQLTIRHVPGTLGRDYLQRNFLSRQNVSFEFDAKIGTTSDAGWNLLVESGGGSEGRGITLAFNQNEFYGDFSGWQRIQTFEAEQWNHYQIVSTLKRVEVYVNGILKYTSTGIFNPRGYLRFSNGGYGSVVNFVRNIHIREVIPDATLTDTPDWAGPWLVHSTNGTRFLRENDIIRLSQTAAYNDYDYLQYSFAPRQDVTLEFDANIGSVNNYGYSLYIESDDTSAGGFFLGFFRNEVNSYYGGYCQSSSLVENDHWNHYRLVYSATRIEVYINGELQGFVTGAFSPRSFIRFTNPGIISLTNYIDNVVVKTGTSQTGIPPSLTVMQPLDGQVTQYGTINISGMVSGQAPLQVTVNGNPAQVAAGVFNLADYPLTEGENPLTIIATDPSGNTSQATLVVKRDSIPPVFGDILPADSACLNTTAIPVSGQVSDASPVTVAVNGQPLIISNGQFNGVVQGMEGWNDLRIEARDAAGNVAQVTRRVFIDSQPPVEFTPRANSSGWTRDNHPVITFRTDDTGSGIDHYEIALGNGNWSAAISPYRFTSPIPDGEQTIQVKAVDKAGNYTVETVKVYIDTTAPAVPEGYEAISGINRVLIHWQDPVGDITGYRLYRTPAFTGTPYRDILRNSDGSKIESYSDTEVVPDMEYSYAMAAIDHAGNISTNTTSIAVKVGAAEQTVDTQAVTVSFENCRLSLAEGTLAQPGTVIIEKSNETLPASDYATPVDVTLSIKLQNQDGQEVKTPFCAPVAFQVSYSEIQLPEGFTAQDLGIYWFNREGGYWERVGYCINNTAQKTLTVSLNHFSEYTVMASKFAAPSLDSYYNLGVSPYQSYFQNNIENVSTSSGSLLVMATDLKIPGPGGLDLEVKRIYDSGAAEQTAVVDMNCRDNMIAIPKKQIESFSGGWSLNLPWVENPSNGGQYLRLPEGQTIKIEWKDNRFEYHQGIHFVLERQTEGYAVLLGWKEVTSGYTLTLADGTRYVFNKTGKPIKKIEPSGKYSITYQYYIDNTPVPPFYLPGNVETSELTSISDDAGRTISLEYTTINSKRFISRIWTGSGNDSREVTYHYNANGNLDEVSDPLKRKTAYRYTSYTYRYGTGTPKTSTIDLLTEIDYPTGGKSIYAMNSLSQDYMPSGGTQTQYGQKYMVTEHSLEGKITRYDYAMNIQSGTVPPNNYVEGTVVTHGYYEGEGANKIFKGRQKAQETYRQIVEKGWKDSQGNPMTAYYLAENLYDLSNYKGNIVTGNRIMMYIKDAPADSYQEIEQAKYIYPMEYMKLRLAGGIEHYRGGKQIYLESFSYDGWGNITRRYDGSRELEETWSYETEHARIKGLVKSYNKINYNPKTQDLTTVTTSYNYGPDHAGLCWEMGKPDQVTVSTSGQEPRITKFTYDDHGNLKTKEDPNGLITQLSYDEHFFPLAKKFTGVQDATDHLIAAARPADAPGEITVKYHFNHLTGLKKWEEDGLGRRTEYTYDKLSRVIRATLPKDDTDPSNPYREYIFDDTQRTCEFYNEKRQKTLFNFDTLGRLYSVVKFTNQNSQEYSKVTYRYDKLGRIDAVSLPFNPVNASCYYTQYEYDGLNRVTRVAFPAKPGETAACAAVSYDDAGNTVTITDENGGVVTEQSDWANRLIKAVQRCSYNGVSDQYLWSFMYDSTGNRLLQTDPAGFENSQVFDGFGQLTEVHMPKIDVILPGQTLVSKNFSPVVRYAYDKMGQKIAETSPNGGTVNYKYDRLGRLVMVTTRARDIFSGEMITSSVIHKYDAAGNKVSTTDGNGKTWECTYSARGFLLTEKDPLGQIIRYQYDRLGNKIAASDARNDGNGDRRYTTWYIYDDQNRLVRTVLPDNNEPPSDTDLALGNYDNPYTEITYDEMGNKLTERDVNGLIAFYDYDLRGRVIQTGIMDGQTRKVKSKFTYDGKGNRIKAENVTQAEDVFNNVVDYQYDSLDRLRKTTQNQDISGEYGYDALGNKTWVQDGRDNRIIYTYNSLGWATQVKDPLGRTTSFDYDPNGNRVRQASANNLVTQFKYDELNRVKEKIDPLENSTMFSYDKNGNRAKMVDPRGSVWVYQYYDNNQLKRIDVTGTDSTYFVEYRYDKAGNRTEVKDSSNINSYNFDELSRLTEVTRKFDGATYTTGYQYNKSLLVGIHYPEAAGWLNYNYNSLNQLSEVVGFTKPQGITYDPDGAVNKIQYANGVSTSYAYDANRRLSSLTTVSGSTNIQSLNFTYDKSNNITAVNEKRYEYDANNQLIKAITPGKFLESKETQGAAGLQVSDYLGTSNLLFNINPQAVVSLDYDGSSIGLDFGAVAEGIKKILLVPGAGQVGHRIKEGTFDLYYSNDNVTYIAIPRSDCEYKADNNGIVSITLKQSKAMRYLKLHVWFDNRNVLFGALNRSTFINELAKMLRVYREADSRTEEYGYDEAGNRRLTRIMLIQSEQRQSLYYPNSDRLKTDGRYTYHYDNAGNLISKVKDLADGETAENWAYGYDLLNRLIKVTKNGTIVAEYGYDPEGFRVVKRAREETTHYVFQGLEPIYTKKLCVCWNEAFCQG